MSKVCNYIMFIRNYYGGKINMRNPQSCRCASCIRYMDYLKKGSKKQSKILLKQQLKELQTNY